MVKKLSLLICILLISPILFSLDYQPLTDSPGSATTGPTKITTDQKVDNLTIEMAKTQSQINTINTKMETMPKIDHLNALGTVMLKANENQLNFYLLIFAVMQICCFLMAGSIYFILKGRGRISDIPIQNKINYLAQTTAQTENKKEIPKVPDARNLETIPALEKEQKKEKKKGFFDIFPVKTKRKLNEDQLDALLLKHDADMKNFKEVSMGMLNILTELVEKQKRRYVRE